MKRRHKHAIKAGVLLAFLGAGVEAYIRVDDHLLERRQKKLEMQHQAEVVACQDSGGKWWRGSCERIP